MNREDIIRMAREAGLAHFYDSEGHCDGITDAQLVTENKERDDDRLVEMLAPFAHLVYERGFVAGMKNEEQITIEAVAAERQRCVDIADAHASIEGIAQKIAAEIRGQQ